MEMKEGGGGWLLNPLVYSYFVKSKTLHKTVYYKSRGIMAYI